MGRRRRPRGALGRGLGRRRCPGLERRQGPGRRRPSAVRRPRNRAGTGVRDPRERRGAGEARSGGRKGSAARRGPPGARRTLSGDGGRGAAGVPRWRRVRASGRVRRVWPGPGRSPHGAAAGPRGGSEAAGLPRRVRGPELPPLFMGIGGERAPRHRPRAQRPPPAPPPRRAPRPAGGTVARLRRGRLHGGGEHRGRGGGGGETPNPAGEPPGTPAESSYHPCR